VTLQKAFLFLQVICINILKLNNKNILLYILYRMSLKQHNAVEYFTNLCSKVTNNLNLHLSKKLEKIEDKNMCIPTFNDANYMYKYNYNLPQLKLIAKSYNLKLNGNKSELVSRIYSFLFLSNVVIKIQKLGRGYLHRKYIRQHGPALKDRSLCTNAFDFLSMDELTNIPISQFFSFKDEDGFIYGFDLLSLYNLIYKSDTIVKNPFNKQPFSLSVIDDFKSLIKLSRLLKIRISIIINDVSKEISDKKTVELRALTLFQNIDALGNYSNAQWFLTLNRTQLIRFVRELVDIWAYRAPLTMETKRAICPPSGNPFARILSYNALQNMTDLDDIRKVILQIMENFVCSGIDKDNKCLGAYYVLGALTLVNNDAATALPWLYQALY